MPTETREQVETAGVASPIRRRGIFALAWAAVFGFVFKHTSEPLQAAAPLQFGDVAATSTVSNSALGPTLLVSQTGYPTTAAVFAGQAFSGSALCGVQGTSGLRPAPPMRCGVYGTQNFIVSPSAGVLGDDTGQEGAGVLGRSANGLGRGVGVQGESGSGIGVRGLIAQASDDNAIAVYGLNNSSFAGPGPGAGGFGVYGLSARGHGLVGATASPGGAAVVGATNGVAGAFAAAFYGHVIVGGDFTVVGGAKSAAVPHPDGSHRRLYCVESPESWFEDFGKARLDDCGRAAVTIDADFAAVADLSDYHVFLTAYGIARPLYVEEQDPSGFVVCAEAPPAAGERSSSGSFSWRVVARRKDIEGARFASVSIPSQPHCPDLQPPA